MPNRSTGDRRREDSEWHSWRFLPCRDEADRGVAGALGHLAAIPSGPTTPAARPRRCCPKQISKRARGAIRVFSLLAVVLTVFAGKSRRRKEPSLPRLPPWRCAAIRSIEP